MGNLAQIRKRYAALANAAAAATATATTVGGSDQPAVELQRDAHLYRYAACVRPYLERRRTHEEEEEERFSGESRALQMGRFVNGQLWGEWVDNKDVLLHEAN